MKGNISRDSHRPRDRFSGVYPIQGGMVTDANLGEQASIARRRVDDLGRDTACRGVPADGGAVGLAPGAGGRLLPFLREGSVYADGVRGELRGTGAGVGAMALYRLQADFPLPPDLPAGDELIVYVDIWERMVSHLEERYLADAGLHGAETAFRSRTMTQIKVAPLDQRAAIAAGSGRFARIGNGELSVTQIDPDTSFDACDPCADTVTSEQSVPNALYRFEVVSVQGDADNPSLIRIAWSSENGAAVAAANVDPEDFERPGAVYELFSTVTESHLGVHHDSSDAQTSTFVEDLSADTPSPATAPEGGDWPYVRRWDGAATIDFGTGTATRLGAGPAVTLAGDLVTITTDSFTATLDFAGRSIVAGDYWLVELRRLGDPSVVAVQALPLGVLHHYSPLFRLVDGAPAPVDDAEERALSFPSLNDIPAARVGLDNHCSALYGDAENVQEALNALCGIAANAISFDPSGCRSLFDTVDNVQDALTNLCRVDFGTERMLRQMMDWGVICGVIPSTAGGGRVRISAGTILDRAGRLGDVPDLEVDLDALPAERIQIGTEDLAGLLDEGQLCLALAIAEGGVIEVHVGTEEAIYGPADPTFLSTFNACIERAQGFDFKGRLQALDEPDRAVVDKLYLAGAKQDSLGLGARLDQRELLSARAYNDEVLDAYVAFVGSPEEGERIRDRWRALEEDIDVGGATGETREIRQLQLEAAKAQVLVQTDQQRRQRCLCEALLPRCPRAGDPPHLVPIACLGGRLGADGGFIIERVCPECCRKQALTWRTLQYFIAEFRGVFLARLAEPCCAAPSPGGPGGFQGPGNLTTEAINLDELTSQLDRGLSILRGREPPNSYQVAPDVGNLTRAAATEALAGNGIEVAEVIDVADGDAVDRIRDRTVGATSLDQLLATGEVQPGDKVALLVQDGVALDYIKLESGAGRYIFPTTTKDASATDVAADLGVADQQATAVAERLAAVRTETATADQDVEALRSRRDQLAAEIAASTSEVEALRRDRADVATELETLRSEQDQVQARLRQLQADLAAAATRRDELATSVRRNMPITAIVDAGSTGAQALMANGITTVGELAALTPVEFARIERSAGVRRTELTQLRSDAERFVSRPIQ